MLITKPRCRWYQFSLRTLLIVVTLLAPVFGWVGHSLSWIRQRQEWRDIHRGDQGWETGTDIRAPGGLWLFGEHGERNIPVSYPNDVPHVERLFPEMQQYIVVPPHDQDR